MFSRPDPLASIFARWRDRVLLLALLLLPWQARFIKEVGLLGGVPWEPGTRSLYATEIVLLAALVLHFLHASRTEGNERPYPPAYLRLWAFVLIFALASVLWASSPAAAGTAWTHLFEGFALAYLIRVSDLPLRRIIAAFLLGSATNALVGSWQFLTQSTFASTLLGVAAHPAAEAGSAVVETANGRFLRAYGLMSHPNVFGGFMAVSLAAAVALFMKGAGRRLELFALGAVALFTAGLVFSFSRAAWIGFAVFFALAAFARRDALDAEARTRLKKVFVAQAATGLLALALAAPVVMTRVSAEGRLERRSFGGRELATYQALELIRDHYAVGTGIGNMPLAAWRELRPRLDPYDYQPAHNVLLLAAVELGFFGFMMTLGAGWAWLADARRLFRRAREPLVRVLAVLPAILFVVAFFDHYPFSIYAGTLLAGFGFGLFMKAAAREPG